MSNDHQEPIENKIRSLTRNEVRVLYWRCRGEQHKQIAVRYRKPDGSPRTYKWSAGLMRHVFRKLGVNKEATPEERKDFLQTHVCHILDKLLGGNEANLE